MVVRLGLGTRYEKARSADVYVRAVADMSRWPVVAKGMQFPFQIAIACWIDLLGYGHMIADAGFNPLHPEAKQALARLRKFHEIVARHSTRNFSTLVVNDGAVAYRDLSLRSRSVTHDFLIRSWHLFEAITAADNKLGHPGARVVLSCGFRMRGRRAGLDASRGHLASIITRMQSGEVDISQAIYEAGAMRPRFDIVPELQANFAFTKAYVAESSGSAGGLPGPNFYVDLIIFGGNRPAWINLGPDIHWTHPRLNLVATFAAIWAIPQQSHPPGGPVDILDGLKVAQRLANDPDVLSALRMARKS
jgi:hypothetical protein